MKKTTVFITLIAAFTLILSACGGGTKYEPEAINEETDVCEVCGMMVPNNQHATQIVLTDGKSLKFDDLGCLHEWKEDNDNDKIGAEFVRDYNTEEWIELKDATFVYHEEFMTPMAYGVYSFKDKADAEALIEEEGKGELLDAEALSNHKWEMNKEMMDHGDHGDHDEHDNHDDHDDDEDHDEHDVE